MRERFQKPEDWQKNIDPDPKAEVLDPEKFRSDLSDQLGKPLGFQAMRCFLIIHCNGANPISQENLYYELTGKRAKNRATATGFNTVLISRIREKLGEKAIVDIENEGYMSRRAWIENTDFKNPPQQKLSDIERESHSRNRGKWRKKRQISETKGTFLSPAEKETLKLMQRDLNHIQIARSLGIKPQTVRDRMTDIYRKLEVPSKKALAISKAIQIEEIPPLQPLTQLIVGIKKLLSKL